MNSLPVPLRHCFSNYYAGYVLAITLALLPLAFAHADNKGGELSWQDQLDGTATEPGGTVSLHESANAMSVKGKRVFVVGSVVNKEVGGAFTVRTYGAKTGKLLWQDQFSGTASGSGASDVTVWGERVFVAGTVWRSTSPVEGPEDIGSTFAVRTYNVKTGKLLWQDQFIGTMGGGDSDQGDRANAIAARGGRVFVAGSVVNATTFGDFAVRTYNAKTGKLLWQDQFDSELEGESDDRAEAIAVQGKRVFVAGAIDDNTGNFSAFTVRTYNAKTGKLLWQDQFSGTANRGSASAIAVQGNRVYVAGWIVDAADSNIFVGVIRAYDTKTGKLVWQDKVEGSAEQGGGSARDIAVKGNRLFVAGSVENQGTANDFTVRAYNAKIGNLIWQNQFNGTANDHDHADSIVVQGTRLFVVGTVHNQDSGLDFTVRTYSSKSGKLLWQNQFDGTEPELDNDKALAVAVRSNRAFVGGAIENKNTGPDFAVRAYRVR